MLRSAELEKSLLASEADHDHTLASLHSNVQAMKERDTEMGQLEAELEEERARTKQLLDEREKLNQEHMERLDEAERSLQKAQLDSLALFFPCIPCMQPPHITWPQHGWYIVRW